MARKRNDEAELTRCVKTAETIVNEAMPPQLNGDWTVERAQLRRIAFGMVLRELLDFETGDK